MRNFDELMKNNEKALFAIAERNTQYNADGDAVIAKGDEWRKETEWDTMYKELVVSGNKQIIYLILHYTYGIL